VCGMFEEIAIEYKIWYTWTIYKIEVIFWDAERWEGK
jgi:hypothetical protein